jgi:hypothetical protein
MPKKAIFGVWHRVRPFHRPKMIPGSVSISWVKRVMLAGQIYHIVISWYYINEISISVPLISAWSRPKARLSHDMEWFHAACTTNFNGFCLGAAPRVQKRWVFVVNHSCYRDMRSRFWDFYRKRVHMLDFWVILGPKLRLKCYQITDTAVIL